MAGRQGSRGRQRRGGGARAWQARRPLTPPPPPPRTVTGWAVGPGLYTPQTNPTVVAFSSAHVCVGGGVCALCVGWEGGRGQVVRVADGTARGNRARGCPPTPPNTHTHTPRTHPPTRVVGGLRRDVDHVSVGPNLLRPAGASEREGGRKGGREGGRSRGDGTRWGPWARGVACGVGRAEGRAAGPATPRPPPSHNHPHRDHAAPHPPRPVPLNP